MAELELIFAKARFAVEFDCAIPRFGERLLLRDARHPLLEDVLRAGARPWFRSSLELTRDRRTLLISGPNTGGKTVTLKTVGLLSLMAHSALPVPAAEAEFPLFEQVLADIGDYQSIQENLSTFSAHVSNIREMALDVTPDSLVLLDELGAATDPEEGGALGVAIVEHFRAAGALHAGLDPPDGAQDLRRVDRGRGERLDGLRRRDLRADLSPAARAARQVGGSRDRDAARDARGHHAARAPLHERPRTRRHPLPRRAAPAHRRDRRRWSARCARRSRRSSSARRIWHANGRSARRPS